MFIIYMRIYHLPSSQPPLHLSNSQKREMSQCVPNWDLDDNLLHHHHTPLTSSSAAAATATAVDYDVTELTWNEVGHLTAVGLGKPIPRYPSSTAAASRSSGGGGGTLECIVDQARIGTHNAASDAMVPCSDAGARKSARVAGTNCTSQGSATPTASLGKKRKSLPSQSLPSEGDEDQEDCGGGSPEAEKGSFAGGRPLGDDEHDSVSHTLRSRRDGLGERRISAQRGREAAVHNQSERKRRDRINQKMKTLQKLLPNSNKTDKASMLDEVIEYLKLLQAQVQMMSRMSSIPTMMLPIAMQHQQLQLSMMAQMTQMTRMGLGLGMIDPSLLNQVPPQPILHPSTFLPHPSTAAGAWDGRRVLPNLIPAFMGCPAQQQPMSSEAYSRLATLYQQFYQQPLGSNQKT